ncbi:MAG: hypothetical protein ABIP45_07185 [Knoellia sp.]
MNRLADSLLALAIHILPQQVRRRYVAEFEADLASLPRLRRAGYAVSTVLGAPRLRWEVLRPLAGSGTPLCYIGRHHERTIHTQSIDPTVLAKQCTRCGRIRDPRQFTQRTDQGGIARTTFGGI